MLLDSVIVVAALATFSWYHLVGPLLLSSTPDPLAKLLAAGYPACDLVLLFCLILAGGRALERARAEGSCSSTSAWPS